MGRKIILVRTSFLARLLNRIPEEYIGVISCKAADDKKLEWLKNFRSLRNQHYDLIFKTYSAEKEIEELETKDEVQNSLKKAREFLTSDDFLSQKFDTKEMQKLKAKVIFEIAEVNRWKRSIISQHEAELKAKIEYMTPFEREIWQHYFEMPAQKKQLEDFLAKLTKSENVANAYEEVLHGAKVKIFAILSSVNSLKKSVEEIQKKLETPDCKKIFY